MDRLTHKRRQPATGPSLQYSHVIALVVIAACASLTHTPAPAADTPPAGDANLADFVLECTEGWGHVNQHPFTIARTGRVLPDSAVGQFLHGTTNHPDMRSPIHLNVDYPTGGRFIVHVMATSGYGGAGLVIRLDGEVRLRESFPADTDSTVHRYDGEYAIDVSAGPHEIVLDNDGADWTRIDYCRLTNYIPWRVEVDEDTARITVQLYGDDGAPLRGAEVRARIGTREYRLSEQAPGVYRSAALREKLQRGVYPAKITAAKNAELIVSTDARIRVQRPRLLLGTAAFPAGSDIALGAVFTDENEDPIQCDAVRARVAGREMLLQPAAKPGHYRTQMDPLPPGDYRITLSSDDPKYTEAGWLFVYEPAPRIKRWDQLIQLRPDGYFETSAGEPFAPLGFAAVHVFQPTLDMPDIEGWTESAWCNAPDTEVADWLALLRAHDVNVVRIGLTVKWDGIPGDMGGIAHPDLIEDLRDFLDICSTFGMRVIPVLYWGHWHSFGFNEAPAYKALLSGWKDWYIDAEAMRLQQQFTREVVRPFRYDPRILAWEPMNEIRPEIDGTSQIPVAWTNHICNAIRDIDKNHLITISPIAMEPRFHVYYARHSRADFINYHFYADYKRPERGIADRVAMCTRLNQLGGKPAILGEAGATGHLLGGLYRDFVRTATRDCYWATVLSGAPGLIGWDGHTTAPEENRMLARILRETGWHGKTPATAPVVLEVDDLRKQLGPLLDAERLLSDRGVWFDVRLGPADGYRLHVKPDRVPERVEQLPRLIEATHPYAVIPMVADGGNWLLAYVRNEGDFDGYGNRRPVPTDLDVTVNLPGPHKMIVWNLDRQERVAEKQFTDHGRFSKDATVFDYVLWVTGS